MHLLILSPADPSLRATAVVKVTEWLRQAEEYYAGERFDAAVSTCELACRTPYLVDKTLRTKADDQLARATYARDKARRFNETRETGLKQAEDLLDPRIQGSAGSNLKQYMDATVRDRPALEYKLRYAKSDLEYRLQWILDENLATPYVRHRLAAPRCRVYACSADRRAIFPTGRSQEKAGIHVEEGRRGAHRIYHKSREDSEGRDCEG